MKHKKRPKTYEAEHDGRKVRVTIPERHDHVAYEGDAAEVLRDVLKDNLSPQAVAVIAAHLHGLVHTKSDRMNREVAWFTDLLLNLVGDQYNALCEEAGL